MFEEIGFGAAAQRMVEKSVNLAQLLDEHGYPDFVELSRGQFLIALCLQSILELLTGYTVGQVLRLREGIELVEALNSHHETLIVQRTLFLFRLHLLQVLLLDISHKLFKLILPFKSITYLRQYFRQAPSDNSKPSGITLLQELHLTYCLHQHILNLSCFFLIPIRLPIL